MILGWARAEICPLRYSRGVTQTDTVEMMTKETTINGRVTRDESIPGVPRPGDYYVKVRDIEDGDTEQLGELVLVLRVDGDEIRYFSLNEQWKSGINDFMAAYDYDPEGADKREEEIREARRDLRELLRRGSVLRAQAADMPQLGIAAAPTNLLVGEAVESGQDGNQPQGHDTGLVPTGELATRREQTVIAVERTKLHVATTRNEIQRFIGEVAAKKARLEMLLKDQEAMYAALDGLSGLVSRLNKIIAVLNVYLGINEEIVQIREGRPAHPGTKIHVRQLVLYADEECAIAADEGGIDWANLDTFDSWLCKPDHLQQVLPEQRGIIAFKPRRNDKKYTENEFTNILLNQNNRKTYYLLRNGEALYRIASEVEVGSYLFPPKDEFEKLFVSYTYTGVGRRKEVRLRPGSREFADAMEKADAKARRYGMVALLIQGLIDRTDVFKPFNFDEINILDIASHEQHITYIRDAEQVLLTGRPSFREWLGGLNRQIEVGQRIIGIFDMYGHKLEYRQGRCDRLSPGNAPLPDNYALHTVERKTEHGFQIFYERDDSRWERYEEPIPDQPGWVYKRHRKAAYKRRASCQLYPSDGFIIPFDLVSIEDIQYYLNSRTERHTYTQMFPLLKMVLKLKEEERRKEEPFRALLIGQIMRVHDALREEAEAEVDGLICWYKMKVKQHRSLLKDDRKAIRMIVAEYEMKRRRDAAREALRREEQRIIEAISAAQPDIIFIGHKKDDLYVALIAENTENIFVREQTWSWDAESGQGALKDEKRWRTVDKRRERWAALWTGARWEHWGFDASARKYLTDPEREELTGQVWELVREKHQKWNQDERSRRVFIPVALAITPEHKLHAYYVDKRGVAPRTVKRAKAGAGIKEPNLAYMVLKWKRGRSGAVCFEALLWGNEHDASYVEYTHGGKRLPKAGGRPWDFDKDMGRRVGEHGDYRVLWVDEKAVARFDADWKRVISAQSRDERLDNLAFAASNQVDAALLAELHRQLRERYDADHNPPELWKAYLKKQQISEPHASGFRKAVGRVLHNGGRVIGKTVREIIEQAATLGVEIKAKEARVLPLDLVIAKTKKKEQDVTEEDDTNEEDENDAAVDYFEEDEEDD